MNPSAQEEAGSDRAVVGARENGDAMGGDANARIRENVVDRDQGGIG
jgi:hypothetical protein